MLTAEIAQTVDEAKPRCACRRNIVPLEGKPHELPKVEVSKVGKMG